MKRLGWSFHGFMQLVLAAPCPLCQRPTDQEFCLDCQRRLQHCQLASAQQFQPGQLSIFAWGHYRSTLKQAIAALKYNHQPHMARPLAHSLATAWLAASTHHLASKLLVVPIPMHPQKKQQRGFNQAELLAKAFCEFTHFPIQANGLERNRETVAQYQLSASDREQNLASAFQLGQPFLRHPPTLPILLLDDIYTTGATARSAAATLRRHGIRVYGIAVIARALQEMRE